MKLDTTTLLIGGVLLFLMTSKKSSAENKSESVSIPESSGTTTTTAGKFTVDASKVRGIRNNNVGNIKIGPEPWKGKVPKEQNSDGTFEQFWEKKYGTRAMIKLLRNYINGGTNTITLIIKRYEEGAITYINFVEEKTGINRNTILSADKTTLKKIVQAIAQFENKVPCVSDYEFEEAYALL